MQSALDEGEVLQRGLDQVVDERRVIRTRERE